MFPNFLLLASFVAVASAAIVVPPEASLTGGDSLNRNDDKGPVEFHSTEYIDQRWKDFKMKHHKSYSDPREEERRKKIFTDNVRDNDAHNVLYEGGLETYRKGVNQFSDMTDAEFEGYVRCFSPQNFSRNLDGVSREVPVELFPDAVLPEAVDWRSNGAVTRVKNQGDCGSCWAFGTTGTLEGQYYIKTRQLQTFSEQNLVDCATQRNGYGCNGCNGGFPLYALQYIQDNGGIDTEDSYQYEAMNGSCRYIRKTRMRKQVSQTVCLNMESESLLQRAVAFVGPISVGIDARFIKQYESGVFSSDLCSPYRLGHAVLVVGYKTVSPGRDYWIVKNSWGTDYGMDGYILMSRNKNNQCGIASFIIYAHLA